MKAHAAEYVVIDVETTGLYPQRGDRIIEIAGLRIKNGTVVETLHSMINPERDIPDEARRIHNITNEMILTAPTAAEFLPQAVEFIGGACLVGHNIKFDLDFVCCQLSFCGRRLRHETPALDTLKMAKELMPHLGSFRLTSVANALGVKVTEAHRALADVQTTAEIFKSLLHLATKQNLTTFQEIHQKFSVLKPVFHIDQPRQESLF
jgi:DNA polymerase III epsilon subunit